MSEETIPQMRDRIKALEKEVSTKDDSLAKTTSEVRRLTAREAFRTQGYDPAQGDLFAASTDGDIDADAINEFASKFNLKPVETQQETEETSGSSEEESQGDSGSGSALEGMSGGSSGTGSGGQQSAGGKTLTRQEYNELQKTDPVAARQAVLNGQVQLRTDNPFAVQR